MWADSTGTSFAIEEAKIDGRKISYPYLLDVKGQPRLESTNDFMIWFCERCDIVTKKSVVAHLSISVPSSAVGAAGQTHDTQTES